MIVRIKSCEELKTSCIYDGRTQTIRCPVTDEFIGDYEFSCIVGQVIGLENGEYKKNGRTFLVPSCVYEVLEDDSAPEPPPKFDHSRGRSKYRRMQKPIRERMI